MWKLNRKHPIFLAVIVLLILIILNSLGFLRPLDRILAKPLSPINKFLYKRGLAWNKTWELELDKENLIVEIESLREALVQQILDQSKYLAIQEENEKLRAQLNFNAQSNFQTISASIVAKESSWLGVDSSSRNIVINKGARDNLRPGLGVISEKGMIVGKILETKEKSSLVCLTNNPGCQLAVSLQNGQKTQGLTDGRLGLTIEMNFIPQSEKVEPGNIVITSGLNDEIPRGLVVGQVTQVSSESNDIWQSAVIDPLLNFNNLSVVSVIIP